MAGIPLGADLRSSNKSYSIPATVRAIAPWAFTIGSAFFDHKFGGTFAEQIDAVCDFM